MQLVLRDNLPFITVVVVYKESVDFITVRDFSLPDFEIEAGGMDYGFEINGILGMDFLLSSGSIINLKDMYLQFRVCLVTKKILGKNSD